MHKEISAHITRAATELPNTKAVVLQGAMLAALYCWHVLERTDEQKPVLAKDIAELVGQWRGESISAETVRQIIQALKSGGLPIESATSHGYWIDWERMPQPRE